MLRRVPFLTLALIALTAALPSAASAAAKIPVIKSVKPLKLHIGQKLTITGSNFVKGKRKNTVIFLAKSKRAFFVKADTATSKKIVVTLPITLATFLRKDNTGSPVATRFQIRVLARRLSKSFTSTKRSPVISPATTLGGSTPGSGACDPNSLGNSGDADGDLLSNGVEKSLHLNPCLADTDGDGVEDGFEYRSAVDLNSVPSPMPYPGKRPYPNPLDPSDGNTDYDGDGMTQNEEFAMWVAPAFGNHSGSIDNLDLNYSDGKQKTKPVAAPPSSTTFPAAVSSVPTLAFLDRNGDGTISGAESLGIDFNGSGVVSPTEVTYQDFDSDGVLSDEEKDVDGDGLTNFDEAHAWFNPGLWDAIYASGAADLLGNTPPGPEVAYPVKFSQPSYLDADTDGDGLPDGLDDQDLDGTSNLLEQSRVLANISDGGTLTTTRADGWVQPFNPCLPHNWKWNGPNAPDCMLHPPVSGAPTPFTGTETSSTNYAVRF